MGQGFFRYSGGALPDFWASKDPFGTNDPLDALPRTVLLECSVVGAMFASCVLAIGNLGARYRLKNQCLLGSYTSSCFHIARKVAAIFLASVSLARLGLVSPETKRW